MSDFVPLEAIDVVGAVRDRKGDGDRGGSLEAPPLSSEVAAKYARLKEVLAELGSVAVAFSGGVDSSLLLKVALDELGPDRVLAVLAVSESLPARDKADATTLIEALDAPYRFVTTKELSDPRYASNPSNRCFFCKEEVFSTLTSIAHEVGLAYVVDGTNVDDIGDHRPGMGAAHQLGVRSPLRDAGLGKADIRALSRHLGLPTWNKPAAACLASRIPYNTRITADMLHQVDAAEQVLVDLGFRAVRVRHHGPVARIEVPPEDILSLARPEVRERVLAGLKALGYQYVTLDLAGYRTGSLNALL